MKWKSDVRRQTFYSGQGNNLFQATSPTGYVNPASPANPATSSCNFLVGGASCILQDYNIRRSTLTSARATPRAPTSPSTCATASQVGDHCTFNVGVRAENQKNENDTGREVIDSTDFSPAPRVVRPQGRRQHVLVASAGRSYNQLPQEAVHEFLLDQFNGYNGYERRLYYSPGNAALGNAGFLGATCRNTGVGYTSPLGSSSPECSGTSTTPV